jgi:hypothetical protein
VMKLSLLPRFDGPVLAFAPSPVSRQIPEARMPPRLTLLLPFISLIYTLSCSQHHH